MIGLETVGAAAVGGSAPTSPTPFTRDSNSRPRAQGTVERDRGRLPQDQDSYQENGGEEEGRKDLVATAKVTPSQHAHCSSPRPITTLPHKTKSKFRPAWVRPFKVTSGDRVQGLPFSKFSVSSDPFSRSSISSDTLPSAVTIPS